MKKSEKNVISFEKKRGVLKNMKTQPQAQQPDWNSYFLMVRVGSGFP